jgi:predicted HD superfamily hydrolase involved in NAD metabolism
MTSVFTPEYYEARTAELKERVGKRRFEHSLGVADTARSLACTYGVNEEEAYLAGLLHDWDKGYDDPGILERAASLGLDLPQELIEMPRVLHGITAATALKNDFPEIPEQVLQAIERHTLAAVDMTPLDMVIYCADALEPGRKGEDAESLRALVGQVSLQELFVAVYAWWVQLIMQRRHRAYSKTIDIWNAYLPEQKVYKHRV